MTAQGSGGAMPPLPPAHVKDREIFRRPCRRLSSSDYCAIITPHGRLRAITTPLAWLSFARVTRFEGISGTWRRLS
jgi:hypothetical protein